MVITRLIAAVVAFVSLQNVAVGLALILGYWERDLLLAAVFLAVGFGIGVPALTIALGRRQRATGPRA